MVVVEVGWARRPWDLTKCRWGLLGGRRGRSLGLALSTYGNPNLPQAPTQLTCSAVEPVHGKDVLHGADAGVFFVGFTKEAPAPAKPSCKPSPRADAGQAKPGRPGSKGQRGGRRK